MRSRITVVVALLLSTLGVAAARASATPIYTLESCFDQGGTAGCGADAQLGQTTAAGAEPRRP